jgi:hypothetical protein
MEMSGVGRLEKSEASTGGPTLTGILCGPVLQQGYIGVASQGPVWFVREFGAG